MTFYFTNTSFYFPHTERFKLLMVHETRCLKPCIYIARRLPKRGSLNHTDLHGFTRMEEIIGILYETSKSTKQINIMPADIKSKTIIKRQTILAVNISFPVRASKPRPSHAARRCAIEISLSTRMP